MSARRGEGLSGGCKAGLTLKENDSFLLPPRRFGACAEADDTVVESRYVLSAPGV